MKERKKEKEAYATTNVVIRTLISKALCIMNISDSIFFCSLVQTILCSLVALPYALLLVAGSAAHTTMPTEIECYTNTKPFAVVVAVVVAYVCVGGRTPFVCMFVEPTEFVQNSWINDT